MILRLVLKPLNFLRKHPLWFVVGLLLLLVWRGWAQDRRLAAVQDRLPPGGFEAVTPGSTVVRTEQVFVRQPNFIESFFKTDAWDRYKAEIRQEIRGEIHDALEARDEEVAELTVIQAVSEGDSARFRFGEDLDHPAAAVNVVAPETYRLWVKPRSYRLTLVETKKGSSYAELEDLTMGQLLTITEFKHRRIARGWDASWFGWGLGIGVADAEGKQGFNASAEFVPLTLHKGGARLDVLRFNLDRHRASLTIDYRRD